MSPRVARLFNASGRILLGPEPKRPSLGSSSLGIFRLTLSLRYLKITELLAIKPPQLSIFNWLRH